MSIAERSILHSPGGGIKNDELTITNEKKRLNKYSNLNKKRHRHEGLKVRKTILDESSHEDLGLSNRERFEGRKLDDGNTEGLRNDMSQTKKLSLLSESSEDEQITLLKNQSMLPMKATQENQYLSEGYNKLKSKEGMPNLATEQAGQKLISNSMQTQSNNKDESLVSKASMPQSEKLSSEDEPLPKHGKNDAIELKPQENAIKQPKKKASTKSSKSKKIYDMPGQKKDTPNELNGARIFYETLRQQKPKSKMAEEYLLKFGLLPYEEAAAIVEIQMKLKAKAKPVTKKRDVGQNMKMKKLKKSKKKANKKKRESNSSGKSHKKTKEKKNKKKAKNKKTTKAIQMELEESSSDELLMPNAKYRMNTKTAKSEKNDSWRLSANEAKVANFIDSIF